MSRRYFLKKLLAIVAGGSGAYAYGAENNNISYQNEGAGSSKNLIDFSRELKSKRGASDIGIEGGGTVQDSIYSIFVDAFGADNTGVRDSTEAVLSALNTINDLPNSCYKYGERRFVNLVFGNGIYRVGDIPIKTGVGYIGQGRFKTLLVPTEKCDFVFSTLDTKSEPVRASNRLISPEICSMTIGYGFQEKIFEVKSQAGGINLVNASTCILRDIFINNLNKEGLKLDFVWDSDFENIRITDCSRGLYIGPGESKGDGSNALRFRGLHIENCNQLFMADERCRHIFFLDGKLEGTISEVSSVIRGAIGLEFNCMEITWQYKDKPMIIFPKHNKVGDCVGVIFSSCIFISSIKTPGWYIDYSSDLSPLIISNPVLRAVGQLVFGSNIQITGGSSYLSGPQIVSGIDRIVIKDVNWQNILSPTNSNGIISFNGYGCHINGNVFHVNGDSDSNSSIINVGSEAKDFEVRNNYFYGSGSYCIMNKSLDNRGRVIDNYIYSSSIDSFDSLIKKE